MPPRVRIDADHPTAEKPWCRIKVQDNGIGFDEKYLDKVFTPFERLHNRSEIEGTGIGLAICAKIVQLHGGTLTATSQPNQGATFIVTLPVRHQTTKNIPTKAT